MENLWLAYTKGKFGYSVQKDLWRKTKGDFENFCRRIGWTTTDSEVGNPSISCVFLSPFLSTSLFLSLVYISKYMLTPK